MVPVSKSSLLPVLVIQEESTKLEVHMQEMKLRLAKQQRDEEELQRLGDKIDTEKLVELAESFNVSDEETKRNTEGLMLICFLIVLILNVFSDYNISLNLH